MHYGTCKNSLIQGNLKRESDSFGGHLGVMYGGELLCGCLSCVDFITHAYWLLHGESRSNNNMLHRYNNPPVICDSKYRCCPTVLTQVSKRDLIFFFIPFLKVLGLNPLLGMDVM